VKSSESEYSLDNLTIERIIRIAVKRLWLLILVVGVGVGLVYIRDVSQTRGHYLAQVALTSHKNGSLPIIIEGNLMEYGYQSSTPGIVRLYADAYIDNTAQALKNFIFEGPVLSLLEEKLAADFGDTDFLNIGSSLEVKVLSDINVANVQLTLTQKDSELAERVLVAVLAGLDDIFEDKAKDMLYRNVESLEELLAFEMGYVQKLAKEKDLELSRKQGDQTTGLEKLLIDDSEYRISIENSLQKISNLRREIYLFTSLMENDLTKSFFSDNAGAIEVFPKGSDLKLKLMVSFLVSFMLGVPLVVLVDFYILNRKKKERY
jgi:hypothetical protein